MNQKNQGSSLIEILIATAIAVMVMVAVAGIAMYSTARTAQAKYQDQATQLSNNLMELFFRERVKLGWYDFYNKMKTSNRFCANGGPDLATLELAGCSQPESVQLDEMIFSRIANVSVDNGDQSITVEVVTSWDGGRVGTRYNRLKHQFKKVN